MLFLRYSADKLFANFGQFLFLYPIFNPKIQNFQKGKKTPRHIIILHTLRCLINMSVKTNLGSEIFLKFNKKGGQNKCGSESFSTKH